VAHAGERLDRFLAGGGGISRGLARRAIDRGGVFVDRHRCKIAGRLVRAGQSIEVNLEADPQDDGAPLDPARLLYVDDDLVAVDKPAGVPAQATRASDRGTLPDLVSAAVGGPVSVVHRLDRETSGVTVFGRSKTATAALALAFRHGRVEKTYLALCARAPVPPMGRIDAPLGPDPTHPGARAVRPQGEAAATRYRTMAAGRAALVEASPETGRTHQVRVHLAHLGAPVLGDRRYGGAACVGEVAVPRLLLHAWRLALAHPRTGAPLVLVAPVPEDFARVRELSRGAPTSS
jgi:23S rRNA pseudouridine1911/1915/1917 synthase